MYSRLHFANYSLLRIRDLSGPYRHRLHTSKEVMLTQGRGKYMSLPDRIIHFTGIFTLRFPVWKINTLSSFASRLYSSFLCSVWNADWERKRSEVWCHILNMIVFFSPYNILVPYNCMTASTGFLLIIPLSPLLFFILYANCYTFT